MTLITGLLPVVGNLIANVVITLVSLSVSPVLAVTSLVFLIVIHKLEYFVNARVMNGRGARGGGSILGGGVSGTHAAAIALGMGANVTVVNRSAEALEKDRDAVRFPSSHDLFDTDAIRQIVKRADLLIGAVLVPGAAAPKLVTRDMLQTMKSGAVLVDIAIDQGGCFETSHPTSHSAPTYVVDGAVHYCVANMPAAVARTSTFALNNVTLPFTIALADKGWRKPCKRTRTCATG